MINDEKIEIKNCNIILTEKQQKYQHYHQVKLVNMNILQVRNITFSSKKSERISQVYIFSSW